MAIHFLNGKDHKSNSPTAPAKFKRAVDAAKTYDWKEVEKEETPNNFDEDGNEITPAEYPKKFVCKKTGLEAMRHSEDDPVMFVDGELLVLTASDQDVKDIIL